MLRERICQSCVQIFINLCIAAWLIFLPSSEYEKDSQIALYRAEITWLECWLGIHVFNSLFVLIASLITFNTPELLVRSRWSVSFPRVYVILLGIQYFVGLNVVFVDLYALLYIRKKGLLAGESFSTEGIMLNTVIRILQGIMIFLVIAFAIIYLYDRADRPAGN